MDVIPIYVDLDGSLIKTDLLVESALRLLAKNPFYIFKMLSWLMRGKAILKHEIAQRIALDVSSLPFNQQFLEWLHAQLAMGRNLVLASASYETYVKNVAAHLNIFSSVLATTSTQNLSGLDKLEAIELHVGNKPFAYAGNSKADLVIWASAHYAILVTPEKGIETAARQIAEVEEVFRVPPTSIKVWLKAIRIHQWLKNLLIVLPLFTSFSFFDSTKIFAVAIAFIAFGLVASATYLVNDLVDLDSDRHHPRKRNRPLASGAINILTALAVLLVMLICGLSLAYFISSGFLIAVIIYIVTTLAYSFNLKRRMLIDVLCLAGLYTWRIIAGAIAINVDVSNWMLAFSMFIFLSLALIKRCAELISISGKSQLQLKGRDYQVNDLSILMALGAASGYLAVMVIALYVDAPSTAIQYAQPRVLWLLCPILLYWISRLWLKTTRGEMHEDPIVYSAKDRGSWIVLALFCMVTLLAWHPYKHF